MSAYALPGLFPPLKSSADESSDTKKRNGDSSQGTVLQSPLHDVLGDAQTAFLAPGSIPFGPPLFSSSCPSRLSLLSPSTSTSTSSSSSSSTRGTSRIDEQGISVKQAKIDPVRLLQSAKGFNRMQPQPRKITRRRNSRERLSDLVPLSPGESKDKTSACSEVQCNGTDEAIEFELSISFNGRKYTATRTLQRIFQLRDDLIFEMETRRQWLQFHKGESIASGARNTQQQNSFDQEMYIEIPEIPPITGDERGNGIMGGFVGRGFTLLHAMATSYVPVIEGWLRNIMAIVPQDSECLTDFLWEPLSKGEGNVLQVGSKSCSNLANLGSITERDYLTSDSDDEDGENW